MKISFVLPGGGVSGGVRVTVAAANHLLERGHKVRILVRRGDMGPRVIYRLLKNYTAHSRSWLKDFMRKPERFKKIERCKFDKDEIIVGVGSYVTDEMVRLQSLSNPKIHYLHGITTWNQKLMQQTLSLPLPKIAVASYLKPLVESAGGGELAAIVPNGINRSEYYKSVREEERDGIGSIYSSQAAKDPKTVIGCIQKFSSLRPATPVRVFGPETKPRALGDVFYQRLPSVEQARDIYSKSLAWIMASKSEGFSVPILEAMACGAIPVVTDCGGTRDIITDGENGFLVEVGNVDQILDRIMLLLDDGDLRKRLRVGGEATVDKFSWEKSIDQLEGVLKTVLMGCFK